MPILPSVYYQTKNNNTTILNHIKYNKHVLTKYQVFIKHGLTSIKNKIYDFNGKCN